MGNTYYLAVQAGFLLVTFLSLGFILWGIYQTALRMGQSRRRAILKTGAVAAVFGIWLLLVSLLSRSGVLSDFSLLPPPILPVLLIPFVVILVVTFHPAFKRFLTHVPSAWLIQVQVFRIQVEVLLWLLFLDKLLPVQMTFEGRNWDVLTGITAPVAAYLCFGYGRNRKWLAVTWNILGLLLLFNIVAIALLSMPTPFRVFLNEPANTIVTVFPIVFLPAVLVPIAYAMHFFSLQKIFMKQNANAPEMAESSTEIKPKYTL